MEMNGNHKFMGHTIREYLIDYAVSEMRDSGGSTKEQAHMAIEAAVDGGKRGTLGGAMLEYYRGVSDAALERLIRDVLKAA